jgi:hypothetical protein
VSGARDAAFLVGLMSQSLGANSAKARVDDAVRALRKDPAALTREDAFEVLERLAKEKGLVGTTARFAKVRLELQWPS